MDAEPIVDTRPKMFRSDPIAFVLALVLIAVYGLGLLILAAWWLRAMGERLTVTQTEIAVERGLISKNRTELAIASIRTVNVHQSPFNRMFNTGKVTVFTAGDKPEIVIAGIEDPHRVRDVIRQRQSGDRRQEKMHSPGAISFRKDRADDSETRVLAGNGHGGEVEIGSIVESDGVFTFHEYDHTADDGIKHHPPQRSMTECKALVLKQIKTR